MRHNRLVAWTLTVVAALGVLLLVLRSTGFWRQPAAADVLPVPPGDQEIAWIETADGKEGWQDFVTGALDARERLRSDGWPDIDVDTRNSSREETTAAPEITLRVTPGGPGLRVRWYKVSSVAGYADWVRKLSERDPPPLAFIGGSSSDTAVVLARALRQQNPEQENPRAPLLLLTYATAVQVPPLRGEGSMDRAVPFERWGKLMDEYPGRSFRFCFTNEQMAETVVDFVWNQEDLRPASPIPIYAPRWRNLPYSADLAERFTKVLCRPDREPCMDEPMTNTLPFSVGDFDSPNPPEAALCQKLAAEFAAAPERRRLLILPTEMAPGHRFLKGLCDASPSAARNLVVLTGDSIGFNDVYRDRDTSWNAQDLPVQLVFFAHRNPTRGWTPADRLYGHAKDELSLEIVTRLVNASFATDAGQGPAALVAGANELRARLLQRYFNADGERKEGSGERVCWLKPRFEASRVLPEATLEVWSRRPAEAGSGRHWEWTRRDTLPINYEADPFREGTPHGR
jgi:hypothetical protein